MGLQNYLLSYVTAIIKVIELARALEELLQYELSVANIALLDKENL